MILTFSSSHNSIKELPTTELPAFTLITGLNGSGKSHLLQALSMGKIVSDVGPNYQTDTRLFTWNDMVPQDTGGYSGGQLAHERDQLLQQFLVYRLQAEEQIRQPARAAGISGKALNDFNGLSNLTETELLSFTGNTEGAAQLKQQIANGVINASNQILNSFQNNVAFRDELMTIRSIAQKAIAVLTPEDFRPTKSPSWGKSQPFQQQFSRLFCQYAELVKTNALKRQYGEEAFSDEDFHAKYMMSPWDFVNETFQVAGLDFGINQPDRVENTVFTPKLTKKSTGEEVLFGNLSSGEKIIMSFALCMYYAGEGRQLTTYPKLLLLDEVDAPLHPSMSRHFISTITETLVKKLGVNVIATTHSPSTVAIAPNESIHVMRVGQPGVHKTSKAEALNL